MIFAITGTQFPFDRLIRILDELAPLINEPIIAQTHDGNYIPQHIKTFKFLDPDSFEKIFCEARLIVSHAGMGTILSALQYNKPIVIFPRSAALGEHRNDHQLATASKMKEIGWVYVAPNQAELKSLLLSPNLPPLHTIGSSASDSLIQSISDFIEK